MSAVEIGRFAHAVGRSLSFLLGDAQVSPGVLLRAENVGPGDQAILGGFLDHCAECASLERLVDGDVSFDIPVYGGRGGLRAFEQGEKLAREERRRLGSAMRRCATFWP